MKIGKIDPFTLLPECDLVQVLVDRKKGLREYLALRYYGRRILYFLVLGGHALLALGAWIGQTQGVVLEGSAPWKLVGISLSISLGTSVVFGLLLVGIGRRCSKATKVLEQIMTSLYWFKNDSGVEMDPSTDVPDVKDLLSTGSGSTDKYVKIQVESILIYLCAWIQGLEDDESQANRCKMLRSHLVSLHSGFRFFDYKVHGELRGLFDRAKEYRKCQS